MATGNNYVNLTQAKVLFIGLVACFLLSSESTVAQKTDSSQTKVLPPIDNMKSTKDSVFFTKLHKSLTKTKFLSQIHELLFRDIYSRNTQGQEITQIEENPFTPYLGCVIKTITIKSLRVFGESVMDTTRKAKGMDKFLNRLHTNTQEKAIRESFLMFKEGDIIYPEKLRDNERLLRSISVFHDARIYVRRDEMFPNFAHLIIVTQDVWSLLPEVNVGGVNTFDISINQANFRGLGHSWKNIFYFNFNQHPSFEYGSIYTIPYIGKSFITGRAEISFRRETSLYDIRIFRPFLTPDMKMAGGFQVSQATNLRVTARTFDGSTLTLNDSLPLFFPIKQNLADLWLARSFKLNFLTKAIQQRSRLILGFRYSNVSYSQRPRVSPDTNQLYRNHSDYLMGIGFSNRRYKRDFLIYGFGITEDVPYGYLAYFVTGHENSDVFGKRWYAGLKFAKGQYLNKAGYIYGVINMGAFSNGTTGLTIESNYFSPLLDLGHSKARHFLTIRYGFGTQRYTGEYLNINNENGIEGVNSDQLWGSKKLAIGIQSVFFSRVRFIGFRIAPFAHLDMAFVTPRYQSLITKFPYTGIGIGIRLRNENLTFNTIQLKLTYFPNLPNIPAMNAAFSDTYNLKLKDFDISAPEIVPFR
jgi:hypothetical protein